MDDVETQCHWVEDEDDLLPLGPVGKDSEVGIRRRNVDPEELKKAKKVKMGQVKVWR